MKPGGGSIMLTFYLLLFFRMGFFSPFALRLCSGFLLFSQLGQSRQQPYAWVTCWRRDFITNKHMSFCQGDYALASGWLHLQPPCYHVIMWPTGLRCLTDEANKVKFTGHDTKIAWPLTRSVCERWWCAHFRTALLYNTVCLTLTVFLLFCLTVESSYRLTVLLSVLLSYSLTA